ncbi:uncharacterized protein LOC125941029 [Dermacentor silvarum]|uniref:uncharacterized protein LOC125941029 n=1 Tax=Dermacentor silvarum TaxID=543639 RepID=UPI002100B45E|nr:uncharacterized protein LOC125941029 [Dermacentor silvarum]
MSQGGDTPETPCADTEEDASDATEASKGCAGYRCEERVNASSVESLASVVVSAGRKRRVPQGITTNQQVRASQVGKKLSSVYLKPRQVQRVSRLSNRTFSQKTFARVKVVRRLLAVRPKYSRDVPDLKEHRRQSVEGCLRAGNNSKARRDKAPSKNGRRQVVDRGSPAPAKQRTRSVSKTVAAKKSALSRTCSVSNKKASKNHVITSTGIIGPEVQFHSLGASWDETPFGGPVGLVALVQPSAAAKGGGRLLHNCDSTDPQGIMTTSATVPGSSEIACTVTEDPPSRGTVERVSVKVEPKPVAMETAVFKDPVVESGGVRSNCATQSASNDAQPSQLRQSADEEPPSQSNEFINSYFGKSIY